MPNNEKDGLYGLQLKPAESSNCLSGQSILIAQNNFFTYLKLKRVDFIEGMSSKLFG